MTQQQHQPHPSVPSPSPLHLAVKWVGGETSGVQVRCGGCSMILAVTFGVTEFICSSCELIQMLPPELMTKVLPKPPLTSPPLPHHVVSHGIDHAKIQLPCTNCKSILYVPHGLARFGCHQCGVDLTVDVYMLKQQIFSSLPPQLPPPPPPPPLSEDVNEVAIEVEREEDGGTVGETFTDYRPPKLSIGPSHPDPVVETSSLSAVQPPEPTYDLKIKDKLECSKALSCLQIETLVYACQRHLQHLPSGARAGFFIGDGAGVGKGRTIAGLIWENWQHGRTKALWISVGSDLKFDARRDLDDVGATCIQVHPLNKLPYSKLDSKSVGVRAGVVFLTYSSLIASSEKGRSRLRQLVQWFGPGYDGLIIFDECHKAKNLVPESGSQPTRTGVAVLDIQSRLPEARIVYCSATGASEPRNMAYMIRLGLWGYGTSFPDFRDFLVSIEKEGVGAMELVAMDMKARGMYVCRTLSYKGAEFEVVEVPLEAKMLEMFTEAAKFWTKLRIELISATNHLSNEKSTSSQLWRLYWASHQRFFRHICMSAKVPAAVRLAKEALTEDKCVVIGLQSTGEAWTEEAVTKYGLDLDDFISGPRELLLKFVEENYPMPEKPEPLPGGESMRELQRKRPSTTPGVLMKGRVPKVAKLKPDSDEDSETDSALESTESDDDFQISDSALESTESDDEFENSDSALESTESDDEFQICEICNTKEGRKKLLQCSCCGRLVHPACLDPPMTDLMSVDLSCSCKMKIEENLQARLAYLAELTKRYEAASEGKLNLLEKIRSMDLPNNPLDDIIDQLGGPEKVAEMTGRRGMFVRASNGKGVSYQARNTKDVTMEMVNMHEKQLFMEGKKLIAIISEAGSAGVSLQADRRAANQKRRIHLTLELPWSADRAIQQFGRTHRSNQTSAPEYRLLITSLGGERRFASIVAKRLESLGALTQGDRRAGPSLSAFNYDSAYGKRALFLMYSGILEQDHLPVVPPGCSIDNPKSIEDFTEKARTALLSVGIIRDTIPGNRKIGGCIIDSDMHDVGRFLNRILGLPPDIQNRLFELFVNIMDLLVKNARDEGNLDSGIVEIKANVVELQGTPKTVHVDQMSGASTDLFTFTLDRGIVWEAARTMLEGKQKDGPGSAIDGFYESKREWMGKRHFILAFESSASGMYKIVRPAVGESSREMPLAELKNKYRKTSSLDKARSGWEGEYEAASKLCMHGPNCKLGNFCTVGRRIQEVNVLGGLILPIWCTIEKALSKQARQTHKRLRVVCVETTTSNQRIVGLFVPNAAVETVLKDLAWTQDLKDEAAASVN